jgi:D-alanyl-D-alanine carboxypeptidase (penicillin-binding protein 5/6)
MRMPLRLAVAVASAALAPLLATASPAAAQSAQVVGGDDLAGTGVLVEPGAPALPQVAATSWLVADLDSGAVLAAKDPHGQYAPASTLKALTALTLIPELPADRVVQASFDDVNVEGSKVGVNEGVPVPGARAVRGAHDGLRQRRRQRPRVRRGRPGAHRGSS